VQPVRLKLRLSTEERLKLLKLEPLKLERQFPLVLASLRHRFFLAESLSARLVG
jgi:hypothetical protein